MNKFLRLCPLIICFTVFGIADVWAIDDGWKKIGESDGIVGYTRPTTRSKVDEIKAVGIVNAPIAVVEAVIRDIPSMSEYMFLCKESSYINIPGMKSAGDVIYFHALTDLPFPVSDRDAVTKAMWSIDKSTGTIYCNAEGVKTAFKQSKDVVRMPLSIIDCTLIPRGADKTEVIYQVLGDPGGELPSFIVNMLTHDYGIKTIAGLRQMVKKDRFRIVTKVITTTARARQ